MNLDKYTDAEDLENLLGDIYGKLIEVQERENCTARGRSIDNNWKLERQFYPKETVTPFFGQKITLNQIDQFSDNFDEIGATSSVENQIREELQEKQSYIFENQVDQAINPNYVGKIKPKNSVWTVTEPILLSPTYNKEGIYLDNGLYKI